MPATAVATFSTSRIGEVARISAGSPPAIASTWVFRRRSGATSQRLAAQISSIAPVSRAASPDASATSSGRVRSGEGA
jgi:hypothetical protein